MAKGKQIIDGIMILNKYMKENKDDFSAEHDQIYYGEAEPDEMTEEDRNKLDELGWFYDEELCCWSRFC